jgi:hypothetical protein
MMVEALIYIGVLFVLLGIGYAALYRCIDHSVALRRNAADISGALQAGERWRADVRAAAGNIRVESSGTDQLLRLPGPRGELQYRFTEGAVSRRLDAGPWITLLTNVVSSQMESDPRRQVTPWRWEVELMSRAKLPQTKPLFTFIAVPAAASTQ